MKNNMLVIGNVERELALSSICIGENRWRWKKRYFSKFFCRTGEMDKSPHGDSWW